MIMKRLIQPMLAELYADHWLDEFLLEGESLDIAWQIHKELQVFEPCGDDDNRTIWIEVPRGDISDWMPYEEAVRYEDVHDEEDYVAAWKASHPRETEWLKVMTSVYDGNIFWTSGCLDLRKTSKKQSNVPVSILNLSKRRPIGSASSRPP